MSKNAPWCLSPQNPCACTSNRAPSSVFAVLCWNCSPESGCRSGSTSTLWQYSAYSSCIYDIVNLLLSPHNTSFFLPYFSSYYSIYISCSALTHPNLVHARMRIITHHLPAAPPSSLPEVVPFSHLFARIKSPCLVL